MKNTTSSSTVTSRPLQIAASQGAWASRPHRSNPVGGASGSESLRIGETPTLLDLPISASAPAARQRPTRHSGFTALALFLAAFLAFANTGFSQILTFEFSALAGNETTASSATNDSGLAASTISRGSGLTPSANGGRFNATNWGNGTIANAVANSNYMEFTITPNSGQQFTVSSIFVQWQRSSTGNTQIALRSSADNYATDLDTIKSVADITSTQNFTWTFSQPASTTPVTYRFYSIAESSGGSGGPGDGTGSDITVTGTVTPASSTAPTITNISPSSGPVGTSVTITGTNFASNATVSFTGNASSNVTFTNNTSLSATVPDGATTGPITVTVGSESATSATPFTIVNPLAPVLTTTGNFTAFTTTAGNASASQSISVNGTNLSASINATAPTGFEVSSDNSTYGPSATIAQSGGTLFARIASTATAGALTGNITLASTSATSLSVPVSGTVNAPAAGAIPITPGATILQDFSSLGENATATLPSGWKVDKNTTQRTLGTYAAAVIATERAGGASLSATASNGIYNFGSSPTARAVGGLSSGTASKSVNLYAALENTGPSSISQLVLSYNAERYRNGSNTAGFAIQLHYSTDGSTWTSAGADFLSTFAANADSTGAAIVPIETLAVTSAVLPVEIPAGSTLYLAWNYSVASGTTTSNAQAIGVSDISITASSGSTPEAPVITDALLSATVGTPFSYSINATNSPTSYGIADGSSLPDGLSLNATTGAISGTPTSAGTTNSTVTATNSGGTGNATLTFVIASAPIPSSPFETWTGGNVTMTPAVLSLYAIGGGSYNGTVAPEAPVLSTTGGNLSLTAIVRTDDPSLTVSGQSLTDLVLGTWSSSEVTSTTEGLDQTGLAAQGLERRRYSVPATGTKKFLRLRAVYTEIN
jgi:hypothetical protein